MRDSGKLELGRIQETLLLPLWGTAVETQKQNPLLIDDQAVSIVNSIPYDFTTVSKNINKFIQFGWIARSIYFDKEIKAFIDIHPEATVVNVGCGLDTTFDRVDNGTIQWIDLDLPDTIDLRRQYIHESDRRRFVPKSVFDRSWYDAIEKRNNVMLLIAGVLFYFDESEVRRLFNEFHAFLPGVEIVFDYGSKLGIRLSNERVLRRGGMDKSAFIKWGIDNILEIEKWNSNIKVISNMPLYHGHKKNFSIMERCGMNIADLLKLMALAHVSIR